MGRRNRVTGRSPKSQRHERNTPAEGPFLLTSVTARESKKKKKKKEKKEGDALEDEPEPTAAKKGRMEAEEKSCWGAGAKESTREGGKCRGVKGLYKNPARAGKGKKRKAISQREGSSQSY